MTLLKVHGSYESESGSREKLHKPAVSAVAWSTAFTSCHVNSVSQPLTGSAENKKTEHEMHHLGKKNSLQVAFSRGTVTSLWRTLPLRAAGPRYRFLRSTFHSEERNSRRKKKWFNFAVSAAESEMVVFFSAEENIFFPHSWALACSKKVTCLDGWMKP